ncbi:MAG: class I adenylate-forming enzyme family protein [Janthinobacterium lividum]
MTGIGRITDVLRVRAETMGDVIAHDDTTRRLTFSEWDREANDIGGGLVAAGLQPGDRVFLPISNHDAVGMAIAVLSVLRADGIAVPVNTRLAAQEVADYANLIEPRFAITNQLSQLAGLDLDQVWTVDAMPRDLASLPDQASLDRVADAEILGTSGTTGKIKGVVVTHPDLLGRARTGLERDRSTSTLHALPFTGSGGNLGVMLLPLYGGATTFTQPIFDPAGFLKLVVEKRPTTVYLVPTMLRLILDHPDATTTDFSSVRYLMTGTAPLPHDSVVRAMALWPDTSIRNSYGMSEGGAGAATRGKEVLKPGCVGKLPVNMQVRDVSGAPAGPMVVGEIFGLQKNPRRYWRDEATSAVAFKDGWTKTGDLGFVDEDGDLIISGRSKELIIRGGYNITPVEIEDVLHEHPAVKDAAVLGVPHDVLGEDIAAAVSLRPGASATPAELESWCRERLANNKVPRTIIVLDFLPLNATGKVLKRELHPAVEAAAKLRSVGTRT